MPPTFLLYLAGLVLVAIAPLVLFIALAALGLQSLRPYALRVLRVAVLAGIATGVLSAGVLWFAVGLTSASIQTVVAHAALVFSAFGIVHAALLFYQQRRSGRHVPKAA